LHRRRPARQTEIPDEILGEIDAEDLGALRRDARVGCFAHSETEPSFARLAAHG
jgi:hypothetical protein